MSTLLRQQLDNRPPQTNLWLGYGCGGSYDIVTAEEAFEVLTAPKNGVVPRIALRPRQHDETEYTEITATWAEHCVCVVTIPEAWDFSTGSVVLP